MTKPFQLSLLDRKGCGREPISLPSKEKLCSLFMYQADTGRLVWKPKTPDCYRGSASTKNRRCCAWNDKHAGCFADSSINNHGYRRVYYGGQSIAVHRLIYKMITGQETRHLDHVNGDRADNRIENLRPATARENATNRKLPVNNKTGVPGIYQDPRTKRWGVRKGFDGKRLFFGYFASFESALEAYQRVSPSLGYHSNHGRAA